MVLICVSKIDIFWYVWNLIIWREAGNKRSSCSDGYKYVSFVLGELEQQLKMQSHLGIFDPVIGEGQSYDDAVSNTLKYIWWWFGNFRLLYSIKLLLDICKSHFDVELIYNLSGLANFDIPHLFRYDWSNMALIQVNHKHIILFMLLIGLIYFGMYFLSDVPPIHNFPSTVLEPTKPPSDIVNIITLCSYHTYIWGI